MVRLRMKNFNMGIHEKIRHYFLGGGGMKNQCIGGELPKKRRVGGAGAWAACRFKRGVCKEDRVMYLMGVEEPS